MKKSKIFLLVAALVFSLSVVSGTYAAMSWQPQWHDLGGFVSPGAVIPSKQIGENLQYLYDKFQGTHDYDNCDAAIVKDIDCKVPYTCNCGKYGCSTCYADGKQDQLHLSCPGRAPITFEGACRDPRKEQQCGKYGCTDINGGNSAGGN